MRNARVVLLAALCAVPASAATHAVLPGCCTSILYDMTVLNGTTGQVDHEFTTPAVASPGFGYGSTLTITKDGKHAVVLSNLYPSNGPQSIRLDHISLTTGAISGSATTPNAIGGGLAVDPQSGLVYVTYQNTATGATHVQVFNPLTASVTLDVQVACNTVLPRGATVYCSTSSGVSVLKASTLQPIGSVTLSGGALNLALAPDRSALYAASPALGPSTSVAFIDTATLQVTQSVSLSSSTGGFALSPDGSQLYIGTRSSLIILNTATLAQTAVPVVPGDQIAVAPNGTLYWLIASYVVLFDPASQTVIATYPSPESYYWFALDPVTGQLAFLAGGSYPSMISATAAEPSQTIAVSAPTGELPVSGAYDRKDNLILLSDYIGDVNILDAVTLQTKGYIPMPGYTSQVLFADGQGYAIVPNYGFYFEVIQFDPLSLQTGANIQVPFPDRDNQVAIVQPANHENLLYIPYNADCGGCYSPPYWHVGIDVVNTQGMTLKAQFPISHAITINGFAISPDGNKGYVAVEYDYHGPYKLLEIDLQTGATMRTASIPAGNLAISSDGTTLYALLLTGGIGTISIQNLMLTNSAPGLSVGAFALTEDGQYIYADTTTGVDIIATASLAVVGSIASVAQTVQPILVEY